MSADPYVVGSNRKIDPNRRRISNSDLLPDGTPNNSDRVEIGPTDLAFEEWQKLGLTVPDIPLLRNYRLSRLVGENSTARPGWFADVRSPEYPLCHRQYQHAALGDA